MFKKIIALINKGQERSIRLKKSILSLLILRVVSILLSFLLVPLTLHYVDSSQYGIWLTLSSIVGWMSFFDIGLSNGLRNRFAQARARNDNELARKYVSTTYALLVFIFIPILIVSSLLSFKINWGKVLNVDISQIQSFSYIVLIVFVFFCLKFILSTINIILTADQRPAESSLRSLVEQALSLITIFILVKVTNGSLLYLSIALCIIPLVVLILFNITLFSGRYKAFSPNIRFVDLKVAPDLFNLGWRFFVIQISGIIKYQTSSLIIIRSFGAEQVTNYNIAYKYFSILPMAWNIFATPIWSAVTEAIEKSDKKWIISVEKKMKILTYILFFVGLIMLLFSNKLYDLWLGKNNIKITTILSIWAFLYHFTKVYGGTYVQILNGLGYLRIQYISTIIALFIFIIAIYILIYILHWGPYSVLIAATISNFNGYFLAPYQFRQALLKNKKGIWVK